MKKIIFFFLGLITLNAQAQVYDALLKKNAEMIKQNLLVVVLFEEDAELSKGKDLSEAQSYKNRIAAYNQNIQEVLPKCFSMYEEVQYKTMKEVFAIPLEERKKISFLVYNTAPELGRNTSAETKQMTNTDKGAKRAFNKSNPNNQPTLAWSGVVYDFHNEKVKSEYYEDAYRSFRLDNEKNSFAQLEIHIYDTKGTNKLKSKCAYMKYMPKTSLSKGELAFYFLQSESLFTDVLNEKKRRPLSSVKENNHLLKERTLLILKDDLSEKVTEANIKKNYPFDFKIVDREEYDKAIMERSEKTCYIIIIPMGKIPILATGATAVNYYHAVVDASTNKLIGYASSSVVLVPGADGYNKVREKHFKKYIKHVNDK